jgi:uncharacterized repeat protein (TIGR03803 family)
MAGCRRSFPCGWVMGSLFLALGLTGCDLDLGGTDAADRAHDAKYTVGGHVSGLASGGSLTLLNSGSGALTVKSNGVFTFATALAANSPYAVTVGTQPTGQLCTVATGTGTLRESAVTNITVSCSNRSYPVGGSVSGLAASGLVLANGTDTLAVAANSTTFAMAHPVPYQASYALAVQSQPAGLRCSLSSGTGTMGAGAVNNVVVSCVRTHAIGGSISGLGPSSQLVLVSGADTLHVPANATSFSFPIQLVSGAVYNVAVQTTPFLEHCTVSNGSGTVGSTDVNDIGITCIPGTESVLYSFQGAPADGSQSDDGYAFVQASDGTLYGTTATGGANNAGTVFKISPAGVETVLWSFGAGNDGQRPHGGLLLASDGNIYGVTVNGGANNGGAVFKVTPAGAETVLWSFSVGIDGQAAFGSLVQASDGNLYGTTFQGGPNGFGTAFRLTLAGVETVLHSFGSGSDGQNPYGGLVQGSDGNLYGTTAGGGAQNLGTVFSLTTAGSETVLYSFGNIPDAQFPYGSLVQATDGNLYGMTNGGGANSAGTVFRITPSGAETVLWSFGSGSDGLYPYGGGLIEGPDGNIYGLNGSGGQNGAGTIFRVTPTGLETVLWSFGAGNDGQYPYGCLFLGSNGILYGQTPSGGTSNSGVVFQFH